MIRRALFCALSSLLGRTTRLTERQETGGTIRRRSVGPIRSNLALFRLTLQVALIDRR